MGSTDSFKHDLLDLISVEYISTYYDFCRIVWAMKTAGYTIEDVKNLARKSHHFDEQTFDSWFERSQLWKHYKKKITMGTIRHYARESDPHAYYELCVNDSDNNNRAGSVAEIYCNL